MERVIIKDDYGTGLYLVDTRIEFRHCTVERYRKGVVDLTCNFSVESYNGAIKELESNGSCELKNSDGSLNISKEGWGIRIEYKGNGRTLSLFTPKLSVDDLRLEDKIE